MPSADDLLANILKADPRYTPQAYIFAHDALGYTAAMLGRNRRAEEDRHVSGQQLLEGIRRLGLHQFGYLARTVFESWGVTRTEDWGEIIFNLVEGDLMRKTDQDSRADFADGYDFEESLENAYFRDRLYTDDEEAFEATSTCPAQEPIDKLEAIIQQLGRPSESNGNGSHDDDDHDDFDAYQGEEEDEEYEEEDEEDEDV